MADDWTNRCRTLILALHENDMYAALEEVGEMTVSFIAKMSAFDRRLNHYRISQNGGRISLSYLSIGTSLFEDPSKSTRRFLLLVIKTERWHDFILFLHSHAFSFTQLGLNRSSAFKEDAQ
jgi:hypothetical protein